VKKDKLLQVRMTEAELEGLQALVNELREKNYQPGITASELVRQAIEKWESIYREIEAGNYPVVLKTGQLGKDGLQELLSGLADLQHNAKNPTLRQLLDELRTGLFLHAGEILKASKKHNLLKELYGGDENE
jgi:hypothetical protein